MIAEAENVRNDDVLESPKLLTVNALAGCLSVSARQVHRMNKAGLIPAPLQLGGCTRWREDEISRWLKCGGPPRDEWESKRDTELVPTVEGTTIA